MKSRTKKKMRLASHTAQFTGGFTLAEVLIALGLMAVIIPIVMQGLRVATLAGEVSERKAMAAQIAERVLNEAIVMGQAQSAQSGDEKAGPFQFHWKTHDEPWTQLGSLPTINTPNAVNQGVVNQTIIHQLSVDVNFSAQNRDYSVHLSTLINVSTQ